MPPTEPAHPASTPDVAVPEKRKPQHDGLLLALMIAIGALLTMAWFALLVLLGWWLISAVA